MKIAAINCRSSRFPAIVQLLEACGAEVLSVGADECGTAPEEVQAVVISGSPLLITTGDNPFLQTLSWIKEYPLPLLGICFGHQLLGMMHGAKPYLGIPVRASEKINWLANDPLRHDLPGTSSFAEDHTEGIPLPGHFHLLASSRHYANEAMKHPDLPQYGVQFHPEVSGDDGKILMSNFIRIAERFSI